MNGANRQPGRINPADHRQPLTGHEPRGLQPHPARADANHDSGHRNGETVTAARFVPPIHPIPHVKSHVATRLKKPIPKTYNTGHGKTDLHHHQRPRPGFGAVIQPSAIGSQKRHKAITRKRRIQRKQKATRQAKKRTNPTHNRQPFKHHSRTLERPAVVR